MTDWIEWAGGECPIDGDALVVIKTRIDEQFEREEGEPVPYRENKAKRFFWGHDGDVDDIVAYRLPTPSEIGWRQRQGGSE